MIDKKYSTFNLYKILDNSNSWSASFKLEGMRYVSFEEEGQIGHEKNWEEISSKKDLEGIAREIKNFKNENSEVFEIKFDYSKVNLRYESGKMIFNKKFEASFASQLDFNEKQVLYLELRKINSKD